MIIREAEEKDVADLKELYFTFLTQYPPKEEQNMEEWKNVVRYFSSSDRFFLLVVEDEENHKVVSSVQVAIIPCLTHNVRCFAVVENVVTHGDYRNKGYASALLQKATEIAKEFNCYKIFLETGSNKESTLNFYKANGFEMDTKHSCLRKL